MNNINKGDKMKQSPINEYATLKAEILERTKRLKELETDLIWKVLEEDSNKLTTDLAVFALIGRKKYKHTPELLERESIVKDQLKLEKRKEISSGKAELVSDGHSLKCTLVKK